MHRLIAQLRSQRQSWVELEPGKRVQIIRPTESEVGEFLRTDGAARAMVAELVQVSRFVTGWDGITEADILGPTIGASDPVAFDADLWAAVVADNSDWLKKVGTALLDAIVQHFEKKAAAEKN